MIGIDQCVQAEKVTEMSLQKLNAEFLVESFNISEVIRSEM